MALNTFRERLGLRFVTLARRFSAGYCEKLQVGVGLNGKWSDSTPGKCGEVPVTAGQQGSSRKVLSSRVFRRNLGGREGFMVAGMTEQQTINIHRKIAGVNLGSVAQLHTLRISLFLP
jgi:hypothetical protein